MVRIKVLEKERQKQIEIMLEQEDQIERLQRENKLLKRKVKTMRADEGIYRETMGDESWKQIKTRRSTLSAIIPPHVEHLVKAAARGNSDEAAYVVGEVLLCPSLFFNSPHGPNIFSPLFFHLFFQGRVQVCPVWRSPRTAFA